jgi:hypothetical protein
MPREKTFINPRKRYTFSRPAGRGSAGAADEVEQIPAQAAAQNRSSDGNLSMGLAIQVFDISESNSDEGTG